MTHWFFYASDVQLKTNTLFTHYFIGMVITPIKAWYRYYLTQMKLYDH